MAATIALQGDKALIAKLQAMAKKGARACLRKSTRKGANVILKEARAGAPVGPTGNYRRGLKLKPRTKGNVVSTWVRGTAPHTALVEFGSKERHTKDGKSTGIMPASHYMKRVADAVGQQALDVTVADLAVQIETTMKADGNGPSGE